jgi:hypothetical protein
MTDDLLYGPLVHANPDAVIHPDLRAAYRGHVIVPGGEVVACYSYEAAVDVFVERDGMEPDDAADFLDYSYVGCQGPHHPLWLYDCERTVAGYEAAGTDATDSGAGRVRGFGRRVWACVRGGRRRSSVQAASAGKS